MISKQGERDLRRFIKMIRGSFVSYGTIMKADDKKLRTIVMQHEANILSLIDIVEPLLDQVLEIRDSIDNKKK